MKLYLSLLTNRRWRQLSGDGCKLYIDLILIAADEKPYGKIDLLPEELAWEVRLTVPDLQKLLGEVVAHGLITASGYTFDVKMLSVGYQDDDKMMSLARSREVEKEKETTYVQLKKRNPSKLYVDVEEFRLFGRDFGVDPAKIEALIKQ